MASFSGSENCETSEETIKQSSFCFGFCELRFLASTYGRLMKTLLTCFDSEAKSSLWPAIEGQSSEAIKELPFRQTADDRQKEESLTAKKKTNRNWRKQEQLWNKLDDKRDAKTQYKRQNAEFTRRFRLRERTGPSRAILGGSNKFSGSKMVQPPHPIPLLLKEFKCSTNFNWM